MLPNIQPSITQVHVHEYLNSVLYTFHPLDDTVMINFNGFGACICLSIFAALTADP